MVSHVVVYFLIIMISSYLFIYFLMLREWKGILCQRWSAAPKGQPQPQWPDRATFGHSGPKGPPSATADAESAFFPKFNAAGPSRFSHCLLSRFFFENQHRWPAPALPQPQPLFPLLTKQFFRTFWHASHCPLALPLPLASLGHCHCHCHCNTSSIWSATICTVFLCL